MTDPAALNVTLNVVGLTKSEARALLAALPPGRSMTITSHQPPLGGARHHVAMPDLSILQAEQVAASLRRHLEETEAAHLAAPKEASRA